MNTSMTFPRLTKAAAGGPIENVWVSFEIEEPTTRKGWTDIKLYAGVVDEMAVEFFRHGGCCVLAAAMHERSSWPLLAFKRIVNGQVKHYAHMGVKTPDGRFLDITGPHPYEDVMEDCGGEGWIQLVSMEDAVRTGAVLADGWDSTINGPELREMIRFFADKLVTEAVQALHPILRESYS